MAERNHLTNGRFLQNLSGWTAVDAVYNAGDGDEHYGVAVLSVGGHISTTFALSKTRLYSIHLAVKGALSAAQAQLIITDGSGNTVKTVSLTGAADAWTDNDITAGLATGTTYTIKVINNSASGAIKIDDIWLWFVPMTRSAMAARVHAKIGRLATERSYSTTLSGALTEGSYTYAIDAGLRSVGAINPETGQVDIRYLDEESLQTALDFIEKEIIEQLQRDYSVEVDIRVGQRQESLSQISKILSETSSGTSKGGGRIVTRKLHHPRREDFEL